VHLAQHLGGATRLEPERPLTMLVVAPGFVMAFGTGGYAQTPSGSGDKKDDKMMDKKQ
jgi:hypothetical protein